MQDFKLDGFDLEDRPEEFIESLKKNKILAEELFGEEAAIFPLILKRKALEQMMRDSAEMGVSIGDYIGYIFDVVNMGSAMQRKMSIAQHAIRN